MSERLPIIIATTSYELEIIQELVAYGYNCDREFFLWRNIIEMIEQRVIKDITGK